MRITILLAGVLLAFCAATSSAAEFDQARELRNFSKTSERWRYESSDPGFEYAEHVDGLKGWVELASLVVDDPERNPITLCGSHYDGCAGDVRLADWGSKYGVSWPVQFVNRNGATISGHVWAAIPKRGRVRRRPAIAFTPGSVQANEEMYWFEAEVLAKHGYVVLTWDAQGQGRSDTFGNGDDQMRGVPSQQTPNFTEGTTDALDFLLSVPKRPYVPRRPAGAARQTDRVQAGKAEPFDPLWRLVDSRRVGLVGQSLGATAVSQVGPEDPRVDAIVALDNLTPPPDDAVHLVPALGMSADYSLVAEPYTSAPDPQAKSQAFAAYRAKGIDTMQINIRGGTHYEFDYISNPAFGASLRGKDLVAWYTWAWLDRYVRGDRRAENRLLSDRWRHDGAEAAVDPDGDGNLFSFYYPTSIATADATCADLRAGCGGTLLPAGQDGYRAGEYSVLEDRRTR